MQAKAHLPADLGVGLGLEAFGERDRAEIGDETNQIGDDALLARTGRGEAVDERHVELDEVRRHVAQLVEARLAGAEIVVGEAHAGAARGCAASSRICAVSTTAVSWISTTRASPGCARTSAAMPSTKPGAKVSAGWALANSRRAAQPRRGGGDAVMAQRGAELGLAVQTRRETKEMHRRGGQVGVRAAPEQLVGNDGAIAGGDDRLQRGREAIAAEESS